MHLIDVHYSPQQVSCPASASPSPRKPARVVAHWRERRLPIRIVAPVLASRGQLALAHAPEYVDGILACELMNGFRGRQQDVADSLPWTCGSFLCAARGALINGLVACSPTSGFHHAGYEAASGYYCTFNGLVAAALALKSEGRVSRVGILGCDQHYGNGTAEIMDELVIGWIRHATQGRGFSCVAKKFLGQLPGVVRGFAGCDLDELGRRRPAPQRPAGRLPEHRRAVRARPDGLLCCQNPGHSRGLEPGRRLPGATLARAGNPLQHHEGLCGGVSVDSRHSCAAALVHPTPGKSTSAKGAEAAKRPWTCVGVTGTAPAMTAMGSMTISVSTVLVV